MIQCFHFQELLNGLVKRDPELKSPGFCAKINCDDGSKYFINFCHSTSVSFHKTLLFTCLKMFFLQIAPPTIRMSEDELSKLIETSDYKELSRFTVPLVLEQIEATLDKKGQPAKLTHAIINSKFYFDCVAKSEIYKRFIVHITIETINLKYSSDMANMMIGFNYVILKNKTFQLGTGKKTFNKFISVYIPANLLNLDQPEPSSSKRSSTISIDPSSSVKPSQDAKSTNEEAIDQDDDKPSNVTMFLDTVNDKITIYIKLDENVQFKQLSTMMNDDRIVVHVNGKVVEDFHVSVPMCFEQAKSSFKKRLLKIECPCIL